MLSIEAPAKLNLTLAVNGRRPDGYHLIESVMQAIDLADRLELSPAAGGTVIRCDGPGVPTDDTNLAARAVQALRAAAPPERGPLGGVAIRIHKRIPVAAGLGGGSANAAAALIGANALWGLGLDRAALARIAVQLGADVPFCLYGGTAIARGIGEELEPVRGAAPLAGVIVNPGFPVSTAHVYRRYDELHGAAASSQNGAAGPRFRPDGIGRAAAMADALVRGDVEAVAALLYNDLQPAAESLYPEIAALRREVLAAGAAGAVLCGSGPSVFGLAVDEDHARQLAAALAGKAPFVAVCRFRPDGCRVSEAPPAASCVRAAPGEGGVSDARTIDAHQA